MSIVRCCSTVIAVALVFLWAVEVAFADGPPEVTIQPLFRSVDLKTGQEKAVTLAAGQSVNLKLVDVRQTRDKIRQAIRDALVTVEVDGRRATLASGNYNLPITVGEVQIDCEVTGGYTERGRNPWALDADARLRLWPKGSPWIRPGTYTCPVTQRWFATDTQVGNEVCFVNGCDHPGLKSIYYHNAFDFGGAEGMDAVLRATDGLVVSAGGKTVDADWYHTNRSKRSRKCGITIIDGRGWRHRYGHLVSITPSIEPGVRVKAGQRIATLGKEGTSGGWAHLHYGIDVELPDGRLANIDPYAFAWQVYKQAHKTPLQAVARPHHLVAACESVWLDATRSQSAAGPEHIIKHLWTFTDGTTAEGPKVRRRYDRPGCYSEVLKVVDDQGRVDYDFAVVYVLDLNHLERKPVGIHAAYWPTLDIKAGDPVTFLVRSFHFRPDEGFEQWDFGDGSPAVKVQSDGNADSQAKNGYAVTTHRYQQPGHYVVRVQRTNDRGETAIAHLNVRVEAE